MNLGPGKEFDRIRAIIARVAEITAGASIRANTALIVNNARFAGRLATRLTAGPAGAPSDARDDRRHGVPASVAARSGHR